MGGRKTPHLPDEKKEDNPLSEDSCSSFDPPAVPVELGEGGDDYIFRFRIERNKANGEGYDDPLLELIRGQLADLLRVVVLTDHGRRVRVDGFRLLMDVDKQYPIFPQKPGKE